MNLVKILRLAGWLAPAALIAVAVLTPTTTLATQPATGQKVTLCHATNSDTNPYVKITVDIASSGYVKSGHNHHAGPIWSAGLKAQHIGWGDIIPSYTYGAFTYLGLNNTTAGLALLAANCVTPKPTPTPTPTPTTPAAPVPTPTTEGATPSPTPSGDVGGETGTPTPTPPSGDVGGATGDPNVTPPPTDGAATIAAAVSRNWMILLLAVAGLLASILILTPAAIRRRR